MNFNSSYFNYNNNLINFIFTITMKKNNVYIIITDFKGTKKLVYSSSSIKSSEKNSLLKKKQSNLFIQILKIVIKNSKQINKKNVAIHFKNTTIFQELITILIFKNFFFIKSIKSFNSLPHNGCRPKKFKRLKRKPLLLV